ncbi:MAG: glycoside hydrolase family 3 N-terminal domain-containing protein [Pseudomonadota bacterium]
MKADTNPTGGSTAADWLTPSQSSIVREWLSRMSLDQKIGQMTQTERMAAEPDELKAFHLGSILSGAGSRPEGNTPADWVAMNDAYWAASMAADGDHLPIPLLYGIDAIHGNNNVRGATIFPHNIGLGAANDGALLARVAAVTKREILAAGVEWTFAPTVAVAQDYRWGRTYESYSSDTDLVTRYGHQFVTELQGDLQDDSVIACAKHFIGDGATTHGIDQGDADLTEAKLTATHLPPFKAAIDAGVLTVMASFNSWNGDKCHGHEYLLSTLLKGRLGFGGLVISDWDGIDYLSDDYTEAIALSVNAGVDLFMVSEAWREFIAGLKRNVLEGRVPITRINDAVSRILGVKVKWGLFDRPRPAERPWSDHASFGSAAHREVARDAVRKSLVLLKNEGDLLPLDSSATILVCGRNANNVGHQCGGFSLDWQGTDGNSLIEGGTSIWQGISDYTPGAELSTDPLAADADPNRHKLAVAVIGETPYAEGMGDIRASDNVLVEAGSRIRGSMKVLEPYGGSLELAKLHPEDLALLRSLAGRGIPTVAILLSGRPLVVNPELAAASAFVAAWLPGSEGKGVADVLFGEVDFSGRLPFAWPEDESDVPADGTKNPLFPRGYGLSLDG